MIYSSFVGAEFCVENTQLILISEKSDPMYDLKNVCKYAVLQDKKKNCVEEHFQGVLLGYRLIIKPCSPP